MYSVLIYYFLGDRIQNRIDFNEKYNNETYYTLEEEKKEYEKNMSSASRIHRNKDVTEILGCNYVIPIENSKNS